MKNKHYLNLLITMFFGGFWADPATGSTHSIPEPVQAQYVAPVGMAPLFSHDSSYLPRCRFVKNLKSNLQRNEIDALLQFITSSPKEVGLTRSHFNSVGDKVINALERQNAVPPELVDSLIAMFRDEEGNLTWRDYCVQHLGSLYATDAATGHREQIRQVWSDALNPDLHMAGTVILALQHSQ